MQRLYSIVLDSVQVTDAEVRLLCGAGVTFFHPALGVVQFEDSAALRVWDLLDPPDERVEHWNCARAGDLPMSRAMARRGGPMRDAWFDDLVNRQGQLPYAIEDLERRLVGRLFLRHVRQREGTSVLGIDLDSGYLGQGFGTDALRAFLAYYFGPARFNKMYLSVAAFNERARRSYDRCGFHEFSSHWQTFKSDADVMGDPRAGRTIVIKVSLCSPAGRDLSSPSITVTAWASPATSTAASSPRG